MLLFNFVEAQIDMEASLQVEFAKLLLTLDFGSIKVGGLRKLVGTASFIVSLILCDSSINKIDKYSFKSIIQGLAADLEINFAILLNRPSFFSIDSVINILIIAKGVGINVNGDEFMLELDTLLTGIWIIDINITLELKS